MRTIEIFNEAKAKAVTATGRRQLSLLINKNSSNVPITITCYSGLVNAGLVTLVEICGIVLTELALILFNHAYI